MPCSPLFPPAETAAQFDLVARDEASLRPGVEATCARLGLGGHLLTRFADGSLPVYAVGDDRVVKFYPPCYREERDRESAVLRALEERLPVPTPRLEAVGECEGWGHVVMERLRGESLVSAWPRATPREREGLVAQVGEALAALHAVPHGSITELGPPDWGQFLAGQQARCVDHQRSRGLDEVWLEQIPDFLATHAPDATGPLVLLHTEVMREHLLVAPRGGSLRLSGLFDFEPAMRGDPEYEFASVGVFVSAGDTASLRQLLRAYGYTPGQLEGSLARRFLAHALLHRYSNLRWYLQRVPARARTLEALADEVWGCGREAP